MRIIKSIHGADGAGTYGMIAEDGEDMWCAYNLIESGDKVSASTIRKVAKEGAAPGAASERIRTKLTVEVISASFDPESASVRVAGRNAEENTWVRMGAHHTIELELHHPFYIEKIHWDSVHLKRLHEARDTATAQADVAAVVMDLGLANVCLLTDRMTIVRAKIEMPIPKKRPGASGHEKALNRFHDAVLTAIRRVVDFEKVKAVILASPGFVREDFYNYMLEESAKKGYKEIMDNKGRFVLAHAASGHKRSLQTVFADVSVLARLNDTRAASEVWALNSFFKALATNSSKAYYGFRHVRLAADRHAVDMLLVSDALFRVRDAAVRRDYVQLVDDVTASGGNVRVFSSMHVTGEQLTQMSGIAALLRFAIEDMDDASTIYASAAARHAKASGIAGEGADVKDGPEHEGQSTHEVEYDSDASSDSDASYKVAAGAGVR